MQVAQSSGQYVLSYQGRYYPFNKDQIVIGSDPRCDIPIENNPRVLPAHAWLTLLNGKVFLQHQNSSAAIWVNGTRVTEVQLQDRAEIAVGDPETRLTLLLNRTPTGPVNTQTGPTRTIQNNQASAAQFSSNTGWQQAEVVAASPPVAASVAPQASSAMSASGPASATDTTRYLCAAGHLGEGFQNYVLRHVIHEERRAMGETYGVNMLAVVSWCKSGIRRIIIRDVVLSGLFLLICLMVLIPVVQSVGDAIGVYNQANQYYSQYGSGYNPYAAPGEFISLLLAQGLGLFLALFVVLIVVYLLERLIKRFWPRSHPGFVSLLVLLILFIAETHLLVAGLLILGIWLTIFLELLDRYYGEATKRLRRGEFEKNLMPMPLDVGLTNKLQENFTTQQRNVVVYSGYKPFAGAGYDHGGWSVVVDITKGTQSELLQSKRDEPLPFTLGELYATVRQTLEGLGLSDVLEIEEKLYVNGVHLPENLPFFDTAALRPVPSVDARLVEHFREHPTEDVRYYQCIRFNFWRGEMVFTAFLRFVRRGKKLFIEVDYLLLPPLQPEYYWVDNREIVPTASKVWELVKRSFDSPIKLWFGVPERLLRDSFYRRRQQKLARIALNNPSFDYGAATSLRQVVSDDEYHLFFQKLDKVMYLKMAEQELLEAIVQFLDEHHIDTTELRERQQTILNNGVIVKGDEVNIGSVQTGAGARATNINTASTVAASGKTASARP